MVNWLFTKVSSQFNGEMTDLPTKRVKTTGHPYAGKK